MFLSLIPNCQVARKLYKGHCGTFRVAMSFVSFFHHGAEEFIFPGLEERRS